MNRLILSMLAIGGFLSFLPGMLQETAQPANSGNKPSAQVERVSAQPEPAGSGAVRLKADERGHYIADFKMNGKPVRALVDTGASMVAINKSTARRLGISVSPADFKYEVSTANGMTKVASVMIREIQIGRVKVRDVEAAVLDDRALDGTLLGMTFLKRLDSFSVTEGDLILKQ